MNKKTVHITLSFLLSLFSLTSIAADWKKGVRCFQEEDYDCTLEEITPLAHRGNMEAQNLLGDMYYNGYGVTKNDSQAVSWYQKAASQGYADSQVNLGFAYKKGQGIDKDYILSAKWYRKAAEQGHNYGQYNLGVSYEFGEGVPKSEEKAVKWYRKAAEQGLAHAQVNLATLYRQGRGTEENHGWAIHWYARAARQGSPKGLEYLSSYVSQGIPDELTVNKPTVYLYQDTDETSKVIANAKPGDRLYMVGQTDDGWYWVYKDVDQQFGFVQKSQLTIKKKQAE